MNQPLSELDLPTELVISIVIPVFNGGESFQRCLASLAQFASIAVELIVIDDGSTDGSGKLAQQMGAQVVRVPKSGGPARARNLGAHMAQGDILFFVDADVTLKGDTVSQIARVFCHQPGLAALIGSYDDAPGAPNFLSQYKNLFHHYTHQTACEEASTFWGACGAIRRNVFLAIGGFDESYQKPCIEDIELGYRLKRAGYSIRLCKDIQVKHLKCWKPLSLLRAEIFYRALPWTELLLSNRQFNADLNLSHANRISVILVFALIGSLLAVGFMPWFLWVSIIITLGLLVMNWDVYRFFCTKRGLRFTLQVIPWHWLYFFYGGAAFAYGLLRHYLNRWYLPELPMPLGVYKSK
jgi:glycosyltransferase involved in cell wall biosynthesis